MLVVWGRGEDGQAGLGDKSDIHEPTPLPLPYGRRVHSCSCGSGHTVILTENGEVLSCGRGDDGRLGHGEGGWKYAPKPVAALKGKRVVSVACGSYHTGCVTDDGACYTWGGGLFSKLGHGDETGYATPRQVEGLKSEFVVALACGSRHTLALTRDYKAYSWGDLLNGMCGVGELEGRTGTQQSTPQRIDMLAEHEICKVAACGFHSLFISRSGRAFTCGEGKFGRLGHGSEANHSVPTMIASLANTQIVDGSCGGFHTCLVDSGGRVWAMGGGEHGQLGIDAEDRSNKLLPTQIASLDGTVIVSVACGWSHTIALDDDGDVWSWGNGDHGKLGHSNTDRVPTPCKVKALEDRRVVSIATYNEHNAAICDVDVHIGAEAMGTHQPAGAAAGGGGSGLNPAGEDMDQRPSHVGLIHALASLVDNPDHADVVFIVAGERVHAHKAILCARSERFRAMFSSPMREASAGEIEVEDVSKAAFLAVIRYLYTDQVDVRGEDAVMVWSLSDYYMLKPLKVICERRVARDLRVSNAARMLQVADQVGAADIKQQCLEYSIRHFDEVSKTAGFAHLDKEIIMEILRGR